MRHKTFILVSGMALLLGAMLVWYGNQKKDADKAPSAAVAPSISIVATFYPLEEFAQAVGGERVTVESIVPAGTEPHEYEPTPQDILRAYEADIFLLNGAGLDPWAEKISGEMERRGVSIVRFIERVASALQITGQDGEGYDPHFWLDPVLAEEEVFAIRDALIARDGAGEAFYRENANRFVQVLAALDTEYKDTLRNCTLDTVVTSHDAFAYLATRYGFQTLAVSGVSPETEPSPRRLAEIATLAKQKGIRHIFFETLVSPKVAETLAAETGAETLVFNPLEGLTASERASGKNYVSIMQENLRNLAIALQCKQ